MNDKYAGNDNNGKPKSNYLEKLTSLSDEELRKETETKIFMSAHAANNHRSDYHWHCDACYDECVNRNNMAIYKAAYKAVEAMVS